MDILEELNDGLVIIFNILIFMLTINISIKRYKKSLDTYWILMVLSLFALIFAMVSDKYFDSFLKFPWSNVFYIGFNFLIFFLLKKYTLEKGYKKNGSTFKRIAPYFLDSLIIFMTIFGLYYYFVLGSLEYVYHVKMNSDLFVSILYPLFDVFNLTYFILHDDVFIQRPKRTPGLLFSIGFIFWIASDFLSVFEEATKINLYGIGDWIQLLSLILVIYTLCYLKVEQTYLNYTSINILANENEKVVHSTLVMTAVVVIYILVSIYSYIFKPANLNYLINFYSIGGIIFILLFVRQYIIINSNKSLIKQLEKQSTTDFLTGVYNKFYAINMLKEFYSFTKHNNISLSVLMLDIDHFKNYNDTWGHPMGDYILKEICKIITNSIPQSGIVSRYGGEEFLILLGEISEAQGMIITENIRRNIENNKFNGGETQPLGKITLSIGGATIGNNIKDEFELIQKADKALYEAKINRNKCVWYKEKL